jgi:hypothetical protein
MSRTEEARDSLATAGDLSLRYGFESWPGKQGPVVAGITAEELIRLAGPLRKDHDDWLEADGEWLMVRQFAAADAGLIIDVAVTRSGRSAQGFLFAHLTRLSSMQPLAPPALPCGRIRLTGIGDVCFALPTHGESFHSIEFVRHNIAVFLRSTGKGERDLKKAAESIDQYILSRPRYTDWRSSGLWISVDKFELPESLVKEGSLTPLFVSVSDPRNESVVRSWELSAGGIVEEEGQILYYAEGEGDQSVTLLIADESGLATSARAEVTVVRRRK